MGVLLEGTSPLAQKLPNLSLGARGLFGDSGPMEDLWFRSREKESPHYPVETAEFPKVGQVNFLTHTDLLVTMDIAQLYTNNPP